jgi:hypothetical protein
VSFARPSIVVLIGLLLLSTEPAHACGDKFVIVGRGSRFQRAYVALHPASLLVLNSKVTAERDLQSSLKIAGHTVRVVSDTGSLAAAVAAGRVDLVLADFRDAEEIGRVLPREAFDRLLLPVIDGSSKSSVAAATNQYKCLLGHGRSMKASRHFLAEIDSAMESKLKSTPVHCDVQ